MCRNRLFVAIALCSLLSTKGEASQRFEAINIAFTHTEPDRTTVAASR